MVNTNLFTPRNLLVIAGIIIAWRVIFSRVNAFLHKKAAPTTASA